MKIPTASNFNAPQVGFDSAILAVLPFPAIVFDITTLLVLKSNSFFYNERDCCILSLLKKYNFSFLDDEDFSKISKALFSNQKYVVHKLHEVQDEIKVYEVHAYLMPDLKNAFFYVNLLSNHKFSDLTSGIFAGWGQGLGLIDKKYQGLINKLPLGVYRTSATGQIIFANPSLASILEYDSVEELYQVSVNDLFVNLADRKKQLERWKKSIINSDELHLKTKKGNIIIVKDIGLGIISKKGEIEYFDGIIEDITDRIMMERELTIARDKALEADRLKTSFLTNMSHEIRTPMNSILGFSSMLKRKGIHHHKREEYLDIIISRSKHLMQVLNDILDITRIEENQVQVNASPFSLNDFLDDLYQIFNTELKIQNKPIKLVLNTPLPTEESLVITDVHHISRIFSNLLNNALKFTENGYIEFGYQLTNDHKPLFYVKDTGIGIAKEFHELIFERFRQADESFTRLHGGLGLGLSICKGLLKLIGGNIWVESDGEHGSVFYFSIAHTLSQKIGNSEKNTTEHNIHWDNKHVLVVEDDPASYEYLNEILSSSGCIVTRATNGKEAVEVFKNTTSFDLILLDIQLPEMNGYETAQKIRAHNPHTPIIAQTTHVMPEDKRKCFDAGCSCYLTKPIQYDILIETLKGYLS